MNLVRAIDQFLTYLRIHKNASPKTIEQYESHLVKLLFYLEPQLESFEGKSLDHKLVFLLSPEDTIKRAEKNDQKRFLLTNCHLELENVKIDDLNEFRLYIAEK